MANGLPSPRKRFTNGIIPENPVFRQVLGICPTLAVSNSMDGAMTMVAAVAFVLICSNIVTSLIRNLLKPHLRILVFTLTIATFVTIADRMLAAYVYEMSKKLGPYVPLIIVNCIIIARCEVCASRQGVVASIFDAVGQSVGFGLALATLATIREILGFGTWFGLPVMPSVWPSWVIMILPPGAFITLGLLMGGANWIGSLQVRKRPAAA